MSSHRESPKEVYALVLGGEAARMVELKACPSCNGPYNHWMKFCPNCGTEIAKTETEQELQGWRAQKTFVMDLLKGGVWLFGGGYIIPLLPFPPIWVVLWAIYGWRHRPQDHFFKSK